MNLVKVFNSLIAPITSNSSFFNAITLLEFPFAKIAINKVDYPIILISSELEATHIPQKNIRLKYLELTHNQECKISENDLIQFKNFSVIVFKSNQENLQNYFLGIAETLIKSLSSNPTHNEVFLIFRSFIEIFRTLTDPPKKTLQGLWAEIFLIDSSKDPKTLLDYWHNIPEEKFDFNADSEKLEVKSNSQMERIHTFASEQLNPPADKQVLIASIFVKQSSHGMNIIQLINSIQNKINDNSLSEKIFNIVSKTLGNSIEQSIQVKFDFDLAKNSLRFYKHQEIQKIEKLYIPNNVTEVRYKSDLTDLETVMPNDFIQGKLFRAL